MSSVHSNTEERAAAALLLVHQSHIKILSLQGHVAHLILHNPGEEIWMRDGGGKAKTSSLCCNPEYIYQQQGISFDFKRACHFSFRENRLSPGAVRWCLHVRNVTQR